MNKGIDAPERVNIELRTVPVGIKWSVSHPHRTSLVHIGIERTWQEAMERVTLALAQWDVEGLFEASAKLEGS